MKPLLPLLLLTPLLLAAAPEAEPRARFQGLFVDWSGASKAAVEAEQRPAAAAASPDHAAAATAGSRALGERVGEIVARGDCADGERVARAAGDFALVAAVRNHCRAGDPQPR